MKKIKALILAVIILISSVPVLAVTDEYILTDYTSNVYTGRTEADLMRLNLDFTDLDEFYWAKESVVRNGALNIVKGYGGEFMPEELLNRVEAIMFIVNALGYEKAALAQTTAAVKQLTFDVSTETAVMLAYLLFANSAGIISKQDYSDAVNEEILRADGLALPDGSFSKFEPATREEIAYWIYQGLQTVNKALWVSTESVQSVYTFSDWGEISFGRLMAVEAVTRNGIMTGFEGAFLPKEPVNRAVMAVILANMDTIYYGQMGIEKKTGIVAGLTEETAITTAEYGYSKQVLIRNSEGYKDVLQYDGTISTSPQSKTRDAVVFKDYGVYGLSSLEEGDVIEYLVETATNTVLYVQVLGEASKNTLIGALESVDIPNRKITVKQEDGNPYTYTFAEGLGILDYGVYYLMMELTRVDVKLLPVGGKVELTLFGGLVTKISYVGDLVVINEAAGIVIENDPAFGYITILCPNNEVVTKRYYENDLAVEKRNSYDVSQSVGYIAQMFPHFGFNPRQTTIAEIEPGDIIYFRTFADDSDVIESVSAAANYIVKYGKVRQIKQNSKYTEVLVEYENNQTAWFSIANGIYTQKSGRASNTAAVQVGDWVKLLVNEAVLAPGYIMETVKEITVEGPEHYISSVIKGNLAGLNRVQNQIILENVQSLAKTGWTDYKNLANFSLTGPDIEFYNGGTRISLDYAMKYFTRSDATVYIGLENSYLGERVKVVTFRFERDNPILPDTVTASSGGGSFEVLSRAGEIPTDAGTIVVRYGRLVTGTDIYAADYVRVVLNGDGAAVVDIADMPDISELMVMRARMLSVNDGVSFRVQSMSMLTGTNWTYTPVQREYAIDYKTIFLDQNGYVEPENFISYTEGSVVDKVFNIVADGSRASYVIDAPYANNAVRGTIYRIENGRIYLKDAFYLVEDTGQWRVISNIDNTVVINIFNNSIIGKNNAIVTQQAFELGDVVQIMTDSLPDEILPGMEVDGFIILVTN